MENLLDSLPTADIRFLIIPVAAILLTLFTVSFVRRCVFKYRLRKIYKTHETQRAPEAFQKKEADSMFKAYLTAERHPLLRGVFKSFMKSGEEEKVIRFIAESCKGENFEPVFGKSFLKGNGPLIRELTGEPEWHTRYFAYKLLIHDDESITQRSLEAGLNDSHPLIRKILTETFDKGVRHKVWQLLWDKLIHDPVFEVRATAKKRVKKEFMDMYTLMDKKLNAEESFRLLELLDPNSQEDKSFATAMLQTDSKEHQYPAAVFLQKCGVLALYLKRNMLEDPVNIKNSIQLLRKAMDVNVSGFLAEYSPGDGAPLIVAANLLAKTNGLHESVYYLAKKVFTFCSNKKAEPAYREIYTKAIEAIAAGGSVKSYELLAGELSRRENDPAFLEMLIPRLTAKAELILSPLLFRFLENDKFPLRDQLVKVLGTFSPDIVLPEIFHILNRGREKFPHIVRISALVMLGQMHLPFCFQRMLESLPTLTAEETEAFARLVAHYPRDVFEDKVRALLASPDAQIRTSIITILPIVKNDSFMKELQAALKDVDPDVRITAIKSLLGFGEIKLLNQEASMLRDPVERVRRATVEVIARHGNQAEIEILKNIMADPNETGDVKSGVIDGLGQAVNAEGIPLLVSVLDTQEEFREQAVKALSMRTSKRDLTQLVEIFRDAEPQLREKIIPIFKTQGRNAELNILEILKEEVRSVKPYLVKILEETGYIEEAKRRLSNRDAEVRREAAMSLSLMDTLPAFRGLVMAAKDPDHEVRICVVRALEKLKDSKNYDFLEKLKQDPDSRVRKYTNWALERLDSLAME